MKTTGAILCTLILAGCSSTVGKSFSTDTAQQIQVARTSQAQVKQALGEPLRTEVVGAEEVWHYRYETRSNNPNLKFFIPVIGAYANNTFTAKSEGEEIKITFNQGTVSDCKLIVFSTSTPQSMMERLSTPASATETGQTSGSTTQTDCSGG